jgi:hypothetical protein
MVTRVHIRRVERTASSPVMVAARLIAELGDGHHVHPIDTGELALVAITSPDGDLPARIAAMLAEARFRGWELVDVPNGRRSR